MMESPDSEDLPDVPDMILPNGEDDEQKAIIGRVQDLDEETWVRIAMEAQG